MSAFFADESWIRVILPSEPDGIVFLKLLLADMAFCHGAKIGKLFFQLVVCFFGHHVDGLLQVCVVGHGHAATVEAVEEEVLQELLEIHIGVVYVAQCVDECVEGCACRLVELLLRYRVDGDVFRVAHIQ